MPIGLAVGQFHDLTEERLRFAAGRNIWTNSPHTSTISENMLGNSSLTVG